MASTRVTTETGSVYIIDHASKTWARVSSTQESGDLRTNSGSFIFIEHLREGQPMSLICPPLVPGMTIRYIRTSKVKRVETPEGWPTKTVAQA